MANSTIAQRKDLVVQLYDKVKALLSDMDDLRAIIKMWDVLSIGTELNPDELPAERLVADYTAAVTSIKALDTALTGTHGSNLYKIVPNVKL